MAVKQIHPYGRWPSEITPEIFANLLKISEPAWGENGSLFWRERSSSETKILMISPQTGEIRPISGDLNVGGELLYGGGAYTSSGDSLIVVDKNSHQLQKIHPDQSKINPLTTSLVRAASPAISPDGKFVTFVHSDDELDSITILDLSGMEPAHPLVSGSDFFNYPRWHPSSNRIAWISWDHPHMPWDSSSLWLADLDFSAGPAVVSKTLVAGGEGISVLQPEFSPDGRYLAYISDQDGWWHIYQHDLNNGEHHQLTSVNAEHGLPPWLQNQQSYQYCPKNNRLYFLRNQEGIRSLWTYDQRAGEEYWIKLDEEYTWLEDISISPTGDRIALVASGANLPPRLITVNPDGKYGDHPPLNNCQFPKEKLFNSGTYNLDPEKTVRRLKDYSTVRKTRNMPIRGNHLCL